MEKVKDFIRWISPTFFVLTIGIFVFIYAWWFRLSPIFSEFGLVLLVIYCLIIVGLWVCRHRPRLEPFLIAMAILSLSVNIFFVNADLPQLEDSEEYGGTTYYLTENPPIFDCCWYHQLTKWQGYSRYYSSLISYSPMSMKLIYDTKNKVVSIAEFSWDDVWQLVYTDSKPPRSYDVQAQIRNYYYYTSLKCATYRTDNPDVCNTYEYGLYQCTLDNTSCESLPFRYIGNYSNATNILLNETTGEINLFFHFGEYPGPGQSTLIYTYGDHPHCYVSGCSLTPNK